jgi:nicotinate-nucleotide adenylyltransferase
VRVGLLGGAFDPIHVGHLNCANQAAERFDLDVVYFLPTAIPPHKKRYWADPSDRLAMVRRAVASNPLFRVSLLEMGDAPSYTIDTVRRFKKKHGAGLYYIIGADAFGDVHSWKSSAELIRECNFVVVSRPGNDMKKSVGGLVKKFRALGVTLAYLKKWGADSDDATVTAVSSGTRAYFCSFPEFGVSSTAIRARIRAGKSIKYLVPDGVRQYIINRGLYKTRLKRP